MELRKIYFDAYKSLLGIELELTHSCLGFVGINESGKSNVLRAISSLSPQNPLKHSDSPKMSDKPNPQLRFEFTTNKNEQDRILETLTELGGKSIVGDKIITTEPLRIIYHVLYDKADQIEKRFFTFEGLQLPTDSLVLRTDAITDGYLVKKGETLIPLNEAFLLTRKEIQSNEELAQRSAGLVELDGNISALESQIEQLENILQPVPSDHIESKSKDLESESKDPASEPQSKDLAEQNNERSEQSLDPQFVSLKTELENLRKTKKEREAQLVDFNIEELIARADYDLEKIVGNVEELKSAMIALDAKVTELQNVKSKDEAQTKEFNAAKRNLKTQKKKLLDSESSKRKAQSLLNSLQEPINLKYSDDVDELSKHLGLAAEEYLKTLLPPVVLWVHNDSYILPGQTKFEEIKNANHLNEISRPLINLFRIGLGTKTLEDIKDKIADIQEDSSERSTYGKKLNREINDYLKSVWKDYDQEIQISLEQDLIRVEFFDPNYLDASHYKMNERSQGCKTFISFLLTIGAEAKKGVITNTILLLDEPETHLHPSGVRYMLQELKKAAKNGNKVLYATHSIFMIDRQKYDRHVILKKKDEQTSIQPSIKNRIGFFMQEEVLYSALDVDLTKDFDSTNKYNFVFEGNGDAIIFEHFYNKILGKKERPFDIGETSFYHGGKCNDIIKYFTHKPIQLGTKWIFILDNDKPANELRRFIENRYKDFLGKDIYIFQYAREDLPDKPVELEDLLPKNILSDAIKNCTSADAEGVDFASIEILIDSSKPFGEYFPIICKKLSSIEEFKAKVKHEFNAELAARLKATKPIGELKDPASFYNTWAKSIIDDIKNEKAKPTSDTPDKKTTITATK